MTSTPDVLSCIQPTADLHVGNYFGAVANWVKLQQTHRCIYGIVDFHAITMPYDPAALRKNTRNMVIDLLACGVDPEKSTLFVQSLVPEHCELCWILSSQCSFGDLSRMTQFKDKSQKLQSESGDDYISAGLFFYPVLQAADILAYRASYVPVGKDQEQHLELSRGIARRFNQRFNTDLFPEPKPLFTQTPRIMSLAQPESKMSKSAGPKHYVGLFEEEASIRKKIKSAVTDTGQPAGEATMSPGVANLFEILRACQADAAADQLHADYQAGQLKYAQLKGAVGDALVALTEPFRRRRQALVGDEAMIDQQIRQLSEQARQIAADTLNRVRKLTGFPKSQP